MPKIAVQFSTERGLGSLVIRAYDHGSWTTHVDAVLAEGLLGARLAGGVRVRPEDYATFSRVLRLAREVTDEQEARWREFLLAQVGKGYDVRAIAGMGTCRRWRDPARWFCSELVAAALERAGLAPPLPAYRITPSDALLLCRALGFARV